MRSSLLLLTLLLVFCSCNNTEYEGEYVRPTKNVILMIPDGTSTSLLSLSKWYMSYLGDGDFELNLKEHVCGLMSSVSSDGIVPCSAAAMSAIVTGIPQRAGNVSVYPLSNPDQDLFEVEKDMAYQPLATIMEAARLVKDASIGVVATVAFHHATPAACASHATTRYDVGAISRQMASNSLDVVFASGIASLDDTVREILDENDVTLIEDDIEGYRAYDGDGPLWSLFGENIMDYELDRDPDVAPSLAEMTSKAIDLLSKDRDGFFLMVEGSMIDYACHAREANAAITEFLAFDEAVGVAMDFARKDGNTTVVVVPDHGTSGITAMKSGVSNYVMKGIDSIFVDMKDYKATYKKLQEILAGCRIEEVSKVFKEWTGIELTDKELVQLLTFKGKTEDDYMKVSDSQNFQSVISSILTSRTNIAFACGGHTSENVFLAAYHPDGDVPRGILTNIELNDYLCKAVGLDSSLEEVTHEYFAECGSLLAGYDYEIIVDGDNPRIVIKADSGEVVVSAWKNVFTVAGEKHRLPVAPVYIKNNESFYLPRQILQVL